jgi:hypothetical protein
MVKAKSATPKAQDFIAEVPSPVDVTPPNAYRFDGAAIHHPMASPTRFADEKKMFKAFDKNDHQTYIHGCLQSQHHLLNSKTFFFARKNMKLANEINDKNTSIKLLTEPTVLGLASRLFRAVTTTILPSTLGSIDRTKSTTNASCENRSNAPFKVSAKIRRYESLPYHCSS